MGQSRPALELFFEQGLGPLAAIEEVVNVVCQLHCYCCHEEEGLDWFPLAPSSRVKKLRSRKYLGTDFGCLDQRRRQSFCPFERAALSLEVVRDRQSGQGQGPWW